MDTPKLQPFIEQLLIRMSGIYQKIFSTTKDIKKEPHKMDRRDGVV